MAEDVLRLAGFRENINYVKQTQIEGGTGRPDYTFPMPKGHALYMDVKFPMASYLRYLEVDTNAEREVHLKRFLERRPAAGQGAGQARLRRRERPSRRSTTSCCSSPTSSSPDSSTSTTRACSTRRWASRSCCARR